MIRSAGSIWKGRWRSGTGGLFVTEGAGRDAGGLFVTEGAGRSAAGSL